ncbi:trna -lysidine synthetase : tRNA(Ile)-lysidine synthase OS=Blastopirellula marina DSM 3645 GN=tilS PE=3 SV=1: ATP_bind_3 [Gemmataceae bacterium]|nr:trna -lysidine synthetase : tRNA(Ile)-lysidine synthase OS=Blastopirellula marina DSM 3645 GN=tilS PE=3 SV=1: ATP_bind_3 [Gemmataceae bacterium]VTT97142.1 trna -lysidine synthetase : tRNA(Ile)-lysidine synthase OS=Blastopirellula marina DSM 3645 GN=tilS PE=3 SV=1: ATP_bind_3 [Gemmataceae bacterium]
MTRVLREVRRFVSATPVCAGPGVVGVSGGADSVALLRALAASRTGPLTVTHVNHGLRGVESDGDAAFVRDFAASLNLACVTKAIDVASLGGNLESTARRVRYEFFAEVARDAGATWIATGHTADDQAETVLHRIVRGTGIQGLRGIARVREWAVGSGQWTEKTEDSSTTYGSGFSSLPTSHCPLPTLTRPLLAVMRADVLDHLASIGQVFREDSSNADPRFTRNRIRHELLPLLRTFNPDVVSALAKLAELANDAHEIVTERAAEVLAKAERPRVGGTVVLDVAALGPSRAVVRAVMRLVWDREGWPQEQMDADAWDRACELGDRSVRAWDFPGRVTMRHTGRVVQIGPRS